MTPRRLVRPGSWYAVLGARAVVLLPPSEKRRVPAVWALADDGAGFDEVLDALIADGLRELSGFALVSVDDDGDARLVLRGAVSAELDGRDGPTRVAGATAATWFEREVRRVNGFRLTVDDEWVDDLVEQEDALLTVADGIARASGVVEPGVIAKADAAPEPEPEEPEAAPEPEDEPGPEPQDVATQMVPTPAPGAVARLLLSHGETVDVDRPVVLGRAPDAGRSEHGEPRLVTLPSPSREISSTHLEIRPATGPGEAGVVATDLGSTNGTVVAQPGVPPEELPTGVAVPLVPGSVIDLGDGISLEVVEP